MQQLCLGKALSGLQPPIDEQGTILETIWWAVEDRLHRGPGVLLELLTPGAAPSGAQAGAGVAEPAARAGPGSGDHAIYLPTYLLALVEELMERAVFLKHWDSSVVPLVPANLSWL